MQNNGIKILETQVLSNNWYTLRKVIFEYQKKDGKTIMLLQYAAINGLVG
jgi:GDP-mannose pyrophosphatase NudK